MGIAGNEGTGGVGGTTNGWGRDGRVERRGMWGGVRSLTGQDRWVSAESGKCRAQNVCMCVYVCLHVYILVVVHVYKYVLYLECGG